MLDWIFEWFKMLYEGNMVAWMLVVSTFIIAGITTLLLIFWLKTPAPAKKMLLNNLFKHHPIIADAYDDQTVRFETPKIFAEGIFYDKKSGWHFHPRITKEVQDKFTKTERDAVMKTFRVEGTNDAFYVAYSGKGVVVNPEIEALIENIEFYSKNPGEVLVPKEKVINVLEKMKDKFVKIHPVHITTSLDPRKIKENFPALQTKTQLLTLEYEAAKDARESSQKPFGGHVALLLVVILIVNIVGLLKLFGLF